MNDEENLNLRGSIRDLRNVAKILDVANFNFSMNALEKFLDGIKVDKPAKPPDDILKPLLSKFLRGDYDFSSREIRNLPFIIYESPITYNDTIKILREMDFSRTSHLRGVLSVYLLNYDDTNKTELLRQKLNAVRNVDSVSLRKIFAASDKLFADERFINMARLFAEKLSVTNSLETIGLSNFYKTSNFIQESLRNFFRMTKFIAEQFKILDELDNEFDTYKNIFPALADALIQNVVVNQNFGKKKCMEIFYRRLGDPRFGNGRFTWTEVSDKSRGIFLRWLVEDDLEIFFKIIKQTTVDRMWRYREKFWRAYLPHISNTWIFLGIDAKRIARQLGDNNMGHGNLSGGTNDQSVFVFQIGKFIFSEWSHNGKLRVYTMEKANNFFGLRSISKWQIIENFIGEWVHSSPKTYSWQNRISKWLRANCNINKTERDWGLED